MYDPDPAKEKPKQFTPIPNSARVQLKLIANCKEM